ncbi:MAG TPA: hypothetical protein VL422_12285, partial [Miltoncostaea sp.]|nr:hypothetical protein [Miltoncostaea sp.]
MGRIAESALGLLAAGPRTVESLGDALRDAGATRSRDPGAAVRRALAGDPRILRLPDGRLAAVAQALRGVTLAAPLGDDEIAAGEVPVQPDLAPLDLIGLGPALPLPDGAGAGDVLVVRIDDAGAEPRLDVGLASPAPARPADEAALAAAVAEAVRPPRPPIAHLATLVAGVAAARPDALRAAGRPLSEALGAAGWETHLGWVGPEGTAWDDLTDEEVDALEGEVATLLAGERVLEAAAVQRRLLAVLRRHLPERVPRGRRALARILAQAGHGAQALEALRPGIAANDAEDLYEAAVIARRAGDEVSARRWAATGAAHAEADGRSEVALCLEDLAHDIDAQAAFLRGRLLVAGEEDGPPRPEDADRVARALAGLTRSYLVEALVEELASERGADDLGALVALLGEAGEEGRQACLAMSAILPPSLAAAARDAAGHGTRPSSAAVAGLLGARPAAAWATSPIDAPDQQQVVVTVAKEQGRVSPLVVLVDLHDLGGAVKDAFFLPDMCEPRLRRELLAPMEAMGLPGSAVDLHEAIELVGAALER